MKRHSSPRRRKTHVHSHSPPNFPSSSSTPSCSSCSSSCSFLGSGPDRGRSPVEWGDFLFVRPFVRPFHCPSPLLTIQPGLRPSQPGLRPSQPGLNPSQPGLRPSQLSLKPEGGTNGRTDGRTNKQKISPFYRTLSPIGAAAQKGGETQINLILAPY